VLVPATGIGVAALVLRLVEAASGPSDWDGAQYVLGARRFDVAHGAPSAPGYWLYVALGHALHVATGLGTIKSLVLLTALASAATSALTVVEGTLLVGRWVGLAAATLLTFTPVSWFDGSTVSTYSFCALAGVLLVVLARRAYPGSRHGVLAVVVLGIASGFMPWVLPMFALLALAAAVASIRALRQLLAVVLAGAASIAVWFVPMIAAQPGHLGSWAHAVRLEVSDAAHASSILYSSSAARANFGVFGAYSLLSLWPAIVLAVAVTAILLVSRLVTRRPGGDISRRIWSGFGSRPDLALDSQGRPWYLRSGAIVTAAIVPPLAILVIGRFPAGGAVLSFLPTATVLLLWPLSRLLRHRVRSLRLSGAVVAALVLAGACALGSEQFLEQPGMLPTSLTTEHGGIWVTQSRYGAPYPDSAAAIASTDRAEGALRALWRLVDPGRDVLMMVGDHESPPSAPDAANPSASTCFRIAGLVLPDLRIAYVSGSAVSYLEDGGRLYYDNSSHLEVGSGGRAVVLVRGGSETMTRLEITGRARPEGLRVEGFGVWDVAPGTRLFGITVTETPGPRPLGGGI
jgi:hypothetical protein